MTPIHSPRADRLHHFDALRAFAMLLGVLWHALMITYFVDPTGSPTGARVGDFALTWFVWFAHAFRLPIFFVMAGFFGALLRQRTSRAEFARARATRVVIPLVVALFTVVPATELAGRLGPDAGTALDVGSVFTFRPYHLWFLYYLALLYVVVLLAEVAGPFRPSTQRVSDRVAEIHIAWRGRLFALTAIGLVLYWAGEQSLRDPLTSTWALQPGAFMYYGWFFATGWLLFGHQQYLSAMARAPGFHIAVAIVASVSSAVVTDPDLVSQTEVTRVASMAMQPLIAWSALFGLFGLFSHWFQSPARAVRYVADAAYWVYLIHIPLVVAGAQLTKHVDASFLVRFALVISSTYAVCFGSYAVAVRYTRIGKVLHGPRTSSSAARALTAT